MFQRGTPLPLAERQGLFGETDLGLLCLRLFLLRRGGRLLGLGHRSRGHVDHRGTTFRLAFTRVGPFLRSTDDLDRVRIGMFHRTQQGRFPFGRAGSWVATRAFRLARTRRRGRHGGHRFRTEPRVVSDGVSDEAGAASAGRFR